MNAAPICRLLMRPFRRDRAWAKRSRWALDMALIGARSPNSKSSRVTAYDMLCTRSSPIAVRWLSSVVVMMPPAQKPITFTSSLPLTSRTVSIASLTRRA